MAANLARYYAQLYFISWNGLLQVHYGFDGVQHSIYDPDHAIPPGGPSLPDPALPSPFIAFPANRPAHPTPDAYKVMAQEVFRVLSDPPPPEEIFPIDAGRNGNWWNGPGRNGEGVQIEITAGGENALVLVVTIYSYDPAGNQIFLVAVGPVSGDSADVDVFITDGGLWGDNFDAALVNETQWGTGRFTALGCE